MRAHHDIAWVGAAPLWSGRPLTPGAILAPDLVRFESDDFMEELTTLLANAPAELAQKVASAKSYRARPPGAPDNWSPTPAALRLYQPVHGHFNLVVATLACRVPGLPDRAVDIANGDELSFVLRRLQPNGGPELAWVKRAGQSFTWAPLAEPSQLHPQEERLPLFQVPYAENDRTRRLWVGLVPTSSRDVFVLTPALAPDAFPSAGSTAGLSVPDPSAIDPTYVEGRARVVQALTTLADLNRPSIPSYAQREVELSTFFLLDLADLLSTQLKPLWAALEARSRPPATQPASCALFDRLLSNYAALGGGTFVAPLQRALTEWQAITGEGTGISTLTFNLRTLTLDAGTLARELDLAYAELASSRPPPQSAVGPSVPRLNDSDAQYCVRCVYRRRRCIPSHPDIVSQRSVAFTIAPFLDPDAPFRPVRIALPVDTSVKGLRRFRKSVAFLVSDQLRKQMGQAANLKELLDGKAGSEQPFTIGEICSFSIPIITLCAFIVLMIFMVLLNFVFWWLPLLKFCFPIKVK